MLIYIEHTPVLIKCGTPSTPGIPEVRLAVGDCCVRKLKRRRVFVRSYLNYHFIPIEAIPVSQITRLGSLAFAKD